MWTKSRWHNLTFKCCVISYYDKKQAKWIAKKYERKAKEKYEKKMRILELCILLHFWEGLRSELKKFKKTTKRKMRKMQEKKRKKNFQKLHVLDFCLHVCLLFFACSWPRVFGVALSGCICLLLCLLHVGLPSSSMIRYLFQYGFMSLHVRQ